MASRTYNNGTPYRQAMGRSAERFPVEDRLAAALAVMDLPTVDPGPGLFLLTIIREMKIRGYKPTTIKNYRSSIRSTPQPSHRAACHETRVRSRGHQEEGRASFSAPRVRDTFFRRRLRHSTNSGGARTCPARNYDAVYQSRPSTDGYR